MQHIAAKAWIRLILEQRPHFLCGIESQQGRGSGGLLQGEGFFGRVGDERAVEDREQSGPL